MCRGGSVCLALPLLLAVAAAEQPLGGAERLARGLQKKVHCAGLSAFECVQCLSPDSLAPIVDDKVPNGTTADWQRERLSVLLLERLSDLRRPCHVGRCGSYEQCRAALRLTGPGRLTRLEDILRHVKAVYVPTSRHKCFTAEDVLNGLVPYEKNEETYVEKVATTVIAHISQGRCIEVGDAVTDFLEDLFKRFGDNSTEVMTQQGLERLLKKLRLASEEIAYGHKHRHEHGDDHNHDGHNHDDGHEDAHDHSHDHDNNHDHGHGHDHQHDHDHGRDQGHNHEHDHAQGDDHHHEHAHGHEHPHDHDHNPGNDRHGRQSPRPHPAHDDHQDKSNTTTADQTSTPAVSSTPLDSQTHRSVVIEQAASGNKDLGEQPVHHHHEAHSDHDVHDDHETHSGHARHRRGTIESPRERRAEHRPTLELMRLKRSVPIVPDHDIHSHNSSASKCWTPRELIRKFGISGNGTISRHEFFHLCPALIQQAVSDVCLHSTRESQRPSTAELYGYGTLSVFIISLCSLMGVLLLPCLARHAYYYIMMGFIGLSFGTMTGDAFLHLIPQVLGLHSHEEGHGEGGHSHSHDHDSLVPEYMWKQLGLIGAIYGLFIFEALSAIFGGEESNGHGHSHMPKNMPEDLHTTKVSSKTESNIELAHCSSTPSLAADEGPQAPVLKSRTLCCGMSTLATMVIIGGAIHNVADGLAIGAAFSSGLKSGLSTSLAVFCHELPHEFGDFVVLISTGLGYRRALFLNFLSALAAFGGLYAGFLLGEEVAARDWILTVTAGIFLYVALVDMLPELKQYRGKSPFKMFIVKNIGVVAGVGIMCVIAIYEDKLNI